MPQHLEQAADTKAIGRGTEQHRHDEAAGGFLCQVGEDGLKAWLFVRQKLFK